jgi:predicted NBD/HSP70 family sugar kinase
MHYIGVDFGGTWIRAGLVNDTGGMLRTVRRPTNSNRPAEEIADDVLRAIEELDHAGVSAIGVGVPTTLRNDLSLAPCPNLPTMSGFPLNQWLCDRSAIPVHLENDARCFGLAEWLWGVQHGVDILAAVTLGTSIGLAFVISGELLDGAHREAGEIWRSPVDLTTSSMTDFATVHDFLSGDWLSAAFRAATGDQASAEQVAQLATNENRAAQKVFADYGRTLGNTLAWVCNILDPDAIVIGGSISRSFSLFEKDLSARLPALHCKVELSVLGDNAGILGAAAVARKRLEVSI